MTRISKSLHLLLLLSFLANYGDLPYLLFQSMQPQASAKESCGCSARICCCTGLVNPDSDAMCGPDRIKANQSGRTRRASGPVLVSCGPGEQTLVLPALKQDLPLVQEISVDLHPTYRRAGIAPVSLNELEVERRIERPPRV